MFIARWLLIFLYIFAQILAVDSIALVETDYGTEKQWVRYYHHNEETKKTTIKSILAKTNRTAMSAEFQSRENDDSFKSWSVFYKRNLQVFKSIHVGEIDLHHPKYRFNCYIINFDTKKIAPFQSIAENLKEFYFTDSMKIDNQSKTKTVIMDHVISRNSLHLLGEEINNSCYNADLILTTSTDKVQMKELFKLHNLSILSQSTLPMDQYPLCHTSKHDLEVSCQCQTILQIGWYPCGTKVCNDGIQAMQDDEDNTLVACGMEYCSHEHRFVYLAKKTKHCLPIVIV